MMAKNGGYNFSNVILTLFICLVPTLGSILDKKAVMYASFCILGIGVGWIIYKNGSVRITKSTTMMLFMTLFSFAQMMWVSDKGAQFAFASVFSVALMGTVLVGEGKRALGEQAERYGCRTAYMSAQIYALFAVLIQIFIKSEFLGCNMELIHSSPTATGFIMLGGMISGIKLFYTRPKKMGFYVTFVLMAYVFIMAKSLVAYLAAAILILAFSLNMRHKRVEAFFALVLVSALAVVNVIYIIFSFITKKVLFSGALRGIVSVVGVGAGGYNALNGALDKAYTQSPSLLALVFEAMGAMGLVFIAIVVVAAFLFAVKRKSFRNMTALLALIAILFTSSSAGVFAIPLLAMYYAAIDEEKEVKLPGTIAVCAFLPAAFYGFLCFARVPYALGQNALEMGRYEEAERHFVSAAQMELFNSEGWEKAYSVSFKAYEEEQVDNLKAQKMYLENALLFNAEDYSYKKLLADVYTNEKNYKDALRVWDEIIARHDNEYLYPSYAQKISDVMANGKIGLNDMTALYAKLSAVEEKTEDKQIKYLVNNILAKSQKYYIDARDGKNPGPDMYEGIPYVQTEEMFTDTLEGEI